jgi:hypothetical protein
VIPDSVEHFVLHASLLMSAIEHSVACVFDILPQILHLMEITAYTVIVAVSRQCSLNPRHCVRDRLCQPRSQPCFDFLFLRFQSLLACPHTHPIFTVSCLRVEECESQEVKVFFRAFEPSDGKYSRFVLREFEPEFAEPRL